MTATKIAFQNATAARREAEATGDQAAIAAASLAELDAWCADFDARHATPAEAPAEKHTPRGRCHTACRVAHLEAKRAATVGHADRDFSDRDRAELARLRRNR